MKVQFEEVMHLSDVEVEDSGMAKNWELSDDGSLFVRLHSWSETLNHDQFDHLISKKVRITIETVE